jgi:hypothetical protein
MTRQEELLGLHLELTVPGLIAGLEQVGGPFPVHYQWLTAFAERLGAHGDGLLFTVRDQERRAAGTATAQLAGDLARAVAILSFQPGGIVVCGRRWASDRRGAGG